MKSIIKSTKKDNRLSNPKEVGTETAAAEEEEAEAKKNTCPKRELKVKMPSIIEKLILMVTKNMAKEAKDIDLRTTNTTIMRTEVVMENTETITKVDMEVAREGVKVLMGRSIKTNSTTTNTEKAPQEINSESDTRILKTNNLLFLKIESLLSTPKTSKILPQKPSSKSSPQIDLPPWPTSLIE
jgi:hypothetical protein